MNGQATVLAAAVAAALGAGVMAFNGHMVTEGSLKVTMPERAPITELDVPQDIQIVLENQGETAIKGTIQITLTDDWRVVGEKTKPFEVGAKQKAELKFQIAAGKGTYSALYPVHGWVRFQEGGRQHVAHPILIVETKLKPPPEKLDVNAPLPVNVVPEKGALPLWNLGTQQVRWQYFDQPLVRMPVGWEGSDEKSRANYGDNRSVGRGGITKRSIVMHPPWTGGAGTIFACFRLRLPPQKPLRLSFANAIRDNTAQEPPSDGVTFRVWLGEGAQAQKLYEKHTDAKTWVPGEVDLSPWAGQEVVLALESHPGPEKDTTCDSSYWGEPVVIAGEPPATLSAAEKRRRLEAARNVGQRALRQARGARDLAKMTKVGDDYAFVVARDGEQYAAVVRPGTRGLDDTFIALVFGDQVLACEGLKVDLDEDPVGGWPSRLGLKTADVAAEGDALTWRMVVSREGQEETVNARMWAEKGALRVKIASEGRITDVRPGPWSVKAKRVYVGHGNCIVDPGAFRLGAGGHGLSASHVGVDFANGISLVQATDTPATLFECAPEEQTYALHTHPGATLSFVPSQRSAFVAAIRYRDICEKKAAKAVPRMAGRFFFDIWGGRYAQIAEDVRRAARYGMTDAALICHNWQRWGYDYRLPDIYPPNPRMGTLEDMQELSRTCRELGILFGPHDNYIDFYPDAEGYSYDHICFTQNGQPIKAWINRGRNAQSYRWRPDHVRPFVERNLKLIKQGFAPQAYFIDVWTSIPVIDFYDREGKFHSRMETQRCWGEAFAWISEYLGEAITCSEAGDDHLVGWLAGADCQHLGIRPGKRFSWGMKCADWERVPWFDLVLHDRFVLYGVGYSGRYQGEQSRAAHGIYSDDYRTAEIMEGHALMSDAPTFCREAVAKYWLAQNLMRKLALRNVESVEFAEDDIHRVIVKWDNGATVYVNRGKADWQVAGRTLPRYGCYAKVGDIEAAIERRDGVIVEQSRTADTLYVDARTVKRWRGVEAQLIGARIEVVGPREFKLITDWRVDQPIEKDLAMFVHFCDPKEPGEGIKFQGDFTPATPTSKWRGTVSVGAERTVPVPDGIKAGRYAVRVGLWMPGGPRYPALGPKDGSGRSIVGELVLKGEGTDITGIELIPAKQEAVEEEPVRLNLDKKPVDFGPVVTTGGFRLEAKEGTLVLTPLPAGEAFEATIRLDRVPGNRLAQVKSVEAVDETGHVTGPVPFEQAGREVKLSLDGKAFAYRIR